ncbi:YD repeat-containing protein [Coniochaeta sp. 2T2.1]|nr:YD repeat-containing protein [Coniochaeta sp. 2T2.1]
MLPTTSYDRRAGASRQPNPGGASAPTSGEASGGGMQSRNSGASNPSGRGDDKILSSQAESPHALPSVSLPKAGGSLRGIGEKFSVNAATGTGGLTVPIATSPGRAGSGVQLSLSYDSGAGSGPFGMGWTLSSSSVRRKTDKGLPRYLDDEESDVFVLSGAEDLVPVLEWDGKKFGSQKMEMREESGRSFRVYSYVPRLEGSFQRVLRLTDIRSGETHWEVKSPDNATMVYGDTDNCRVANPDNPAQVFEWLPSKTYDERGNMTIFMYKAEDSAGVDIDAPHEHHRTSQSRSAARYIKSIKYGNTVSRASARFASGTDWLFEVVFDYGEHDRSVPTPRECHPWLCRPDSFSSHRSGFEIRMYRLCRRVLMFHHFPDEANVGRDCVVTSFNLSYETIGRDERTGLGVSTTVKSVSHEYWRRNGSGYDHESLPPLELTYSKAEPARFPRDLDSEALANLPIGFNSTSYQLIDLEGQGLAGAVTKVNGGLLYIPNNGEGEFGAAETLLQVPAPIFSSNAPVWVDLDGDGKVELVQWDGPTPGSYSRDWDEESGWETFRPFDSLPNLKWNDANVKFVDVTGDGLTDVVILHDDLLRVYYGRGKAGFGDEEFVPTSLDEDQGPRLLFWDGVEVLYTADMTGDGLSDIVRICPSEVCYWPSNGYGKFGRKVTMEKPPAFDNPANFDQSLIKLADIDGTGTTDLIYLGGSVPTMYLNLAGNGWSEGIPLHGFPSVNSTTTNVQVTDLLGKGTACLVWSSSLPGDSGRQVRYLDLMEQGKPYLLVATDNNTGLETCVTYSSSSIFYARDKKAGRRWISHLPFPVQVVEKNETIDRISGTIFTTRYAYHDGYFNGPEREFGGFGMVETWDTEHYSDLDAEQRSYANINETSHIPPVLGKTWYHTGQYFDDQCPTRQRRYQYFGDLDLHPELAEMRLSDTVLPTTLTAPSGPALYNVNYQEQREAYRALKGAVLRSEIYAIDGTDLQNIPFSISESTFVIEQRQPLGGNKHGVFFVHAKESMDMLYDRKMYHVGPKTRLDPRVNHSLTLEVDCFGNPLRTLAINYGRRHDELGSILTNEDRERQRRTYALMTETTYTNMIDTVKDYVLPTIAESSTFEVINVKTAVSHRRGDSCWVDFQSARDMAKRLSTGQFDIPFEVFDGPYPSKTTPFRRLTKQSRSIFRRNDLSGPLPFGVIESMMLPYKNYGNVFTDSQVAEYVLAGKVNAEEVPELFGGEGAYARFDDVDGWWSGSGEAFYSPNRNDSPKEELRYAVENFYFVYRSRTPWDKDTATAETYYSYDKYNLLAKEVVDPYQNRGSVGERDKDSTKPFLKSGHDYRLLAPFILMDHNRNRTEVAFDIFGRVVASAVKGKPEDDDGDNLVGLKTDLTDKEVRAYFQAPLLNASTLLGSATTRTIYDIYVYWRTKDLEHPLPDWSSTITRETHISELDDGAESRVFVGFSFVDGTGRVVQAKAQCEPGPLEPDDALENTKKRDQPPKEIVHHRWQTSSWIVYNNKGSAVRNYEPFFSDTHRFQDRAMYGVSPTFIYDALSRNVAVINADHSFSKIVFSPWSSESWDKTDTVLIHNPSEDPNVGALIKRLPRDEYLPTWYGQRSTGALGAEEEKAAKASAVNANTPSRTFFDAMGHDCVKFEILRHAGSKSGKVRDEIVRQANYTDVQSLPYKVIDTLGRTTSLLTYSLGKLVIREVHMDNGEKWTLKDIAGSPIRTWNGRGQVFKPVYDRMRRAIALRIVDGDQDYLVEKTELGESLPDGEATNSRGKVIQAWDQSGVTKTPAYDFKGNLILSTRQLAKATHGVIDWGGGQVELEMESYEEVVKSNALNKVTMTRLPDGTQTWYTYNERAIQQTISTTLPGDRGTQKVIEEIDYDAKGQRTRVVQGNGLVTRVSFDRFTFKLRRIVTTRNLTRRGSPSGTDSDKDGSSSSRSSRSSSKRRSSEKRRRQHKTERIQDLRYTYDVSGNIVHIKDDAKQRVFFRNRCVDPSQSFRYDSLCRLVEATGREHMGQMEAAKAGSAKPGKQPGSAGEAAGDHPHDGKALGRYIESYEYDTQGNILALHHETLGESRAWTRHYDYKERSAILESEYNNRLTRTRVGKTIEEYRYDGPSGVTGCMTSMSGLPLLGYDYGDKMVATAPLPHSLEKGPAQETTYYRYDATGKRVRKVTERSNADGTSTLVKETIYIGGAFEMFRRYSGSGGEVTLQIHSLSIAESGRRLLLIDNRTIGADTRSPSTLYRYQLANHQGSATMEVDHEARILSYEEYTPYGVSSLRSMFSQSEVPKRYRFLGKEHDDSGLYHFEARYYAAWLGRFTAADPKGAADGLNLYQYAQSNPVMLADPGGTAAGPVDEALGWTQRVLAQRANLLNRAGQAFEGTSLGRLITNNNITGNQATKDFARMLQNEASVGKAIFEEYFAGPVAGSLKGSSKADMIFEGAEGVWEHKVIDARRYLKQDGTWRKSGLDKLTKKLEEDAGQIENLITNMKGKFDSVKLGVTVKGVAKDSTEIATFTDKIKEIMSAKGVVQDLKFVHELEPALVHAKEEINAAARIASPVVEQLAHAGGVAKTVLKKAGPIGVGIVAGLTVLGIAGNARAATTGSTLLDDKPQTHGERLQAGLDAASDATGLVATAVPALLAKGVIGAGTAAGVTVVAAAAGGAATGAMVGSYVADKLEKPFQEALGERAGAAAAAGTGVLAGAATGAAVGALIGSVVPGVGTAVGAAVGGVAGAVGAGAKILIDRFW